MGNQTLSQSRTSTITYNKYNEQYHQRYPEPISQSTTNTITYNEQEWRCNACTFINTSLNITSCEMCGTLRSNIKKKKKRKKRLRKSKRVNIDNIPNDEYIKESGKYMKVFGYIRMFENETPDFNQIIPTEIKQMIHAFQLCDCWDIEYSDPNLEINGDSIIKKYGGCGICTAFGIDIVEPGMKYVWYIRIKSSSFRYKKIKGFFLNIGIVPDHRVKKQMGTSWKTYGYGINCGKAQLIGNDCFAKGTEKEYGATFTNPGDVMQIALDLRKKKATTLSFCINGCDFGVAFEHIPQDYYVLVVNISTAIDNIKLEFL